MFKRLLKNWKTTAAGVVVLGTGVATAFHFITEETAAAIITLATAAGLIGAKDGNVTDGTKAQDGATPSTVDGSSNPDKPRGGG